MAACWDDVMVQTLRIMTNDLSDDPENTDESLKQLIIVAARIVMMSVDFDQVYTLDMGNSTITPDPSSDEAFVNLVCMKAACILARSEQKDRARKGLAVKDGPFNIDGRGAADAAGKWSDTICEEFAKAELSYRLGNFQPGQAIVGPYNFQSYGESR
jgi:hypothetical protein